MAGELFTRCAFGAYADNTAGHETLERRVGAKLRRYVTFQDLPSVGGGDGWPQADADWCARTDHDLVIAWDIHSNINLNGDQLLRGEINAQLDSFFRKAKAFAVNGRKVVLRMWWEFNDGNGRKVGKSNTAWPGGYAQWRDGWRFVYRRAKETNAVGTGVEFFWCANGSDNTGLRMEEFWPGAEFVDMVGLDTYNDHWAPWTEFADKIQPMMSRIEALPGAAGKPQGIGETGSLDTNGGKANWHRNMFLTQRWPNLKAIDFFSTNKEADWRIDYPEVVRLVCAEYLPKAPQGTGTTTPPPVVPAPTPVAPGTPPIVTLAPPKLTADGTYDIDVSWTAPSGTVTGYHVAQISSSQWKSDPLPASPRTFTLGGFKDKEQVTVVVTALNGTAEGKGTQASVMVNATAPTPTTPTTPTPAPSLGLPLLARGTTDREATRTLQGLLIARGFAPARTIKADGTVDGGFGSGTEAAVKKFQTAVGISASGTTTDATWRKLLRL